MELTIRVGAAVDRSMSEAFRPLIRSAEQARTALERTSKQSSNTAAAEAKRGANDQARAYQKTSKEIERWERERVRMAERAAAAKSRLAEAAARADVRATEKAAREKAQIEARERAATERAARQAAREQLAILREVDRAASGGGRSANDNGERRVKKAAKDGRFLDPHRNVDAAAGAAMRAGRAAVGIAGDIARGSGVRTDLGGFMAGEVDLEKRAVDLTNAAYMPGQAGPNGKRADAAEVTAQMRQVGNATAFDPVKALEGLQKFVAKTGDLATGRDIIQDMARYSRASGAELDDMVDAAGDVSNALGDTDNKGEKIKNVMRMIAAQGKEGAVEIKDLATQMAKLGAASSQFSGDSSMVLAQMGAITQMARAKGGAASATQAATSVGSFTNTFSKGARLDAFKHYGVDIYGKDQKVDLKKTILGSIKAASSEEHGGMKEFNRNMGKMFMDVAARRAVKGYETTFKDAGGGEAGLKAVEKAIDDMVAATMAEKEITESFTKSMNTTEAQVQLFNNAMSANANELKTVLLPAFQSLGPLIISTTKGMVDWLGQVTGTTQAANDTKNVAAENAALNAKSGLGGMAGKSVVTDTEAQRGLEEAAKAKAELQAAIDRKGKEVAAERSKFDLGLGQSMSEEEIRKEAKSDMGGDDARKYLRDKEQLTRMKDTLEQLNAKQAEVADKIAAKTLRVLIVGDTRPPEMTDAPRAASPEQKAKKK